MGLLLCLPPWMKAEEEGTGCLRKMLDSSQMHTHAVRPFLQADF